MPDAKLSLLGGLDIAGDASDGRLLTRKARGMLAYLALHPRQPQSREKLAAMFWGGTAETQARTNLRQALSSLRKALTSLDGAHLRTESDHVALDLNAKKIYWAENNNALVQRANLDGSNVEPVLSDVMEAWALELYLCSP